MEIVMVEFAVGDELVGECVAALNELMHSVVATQAQFHGATIHIEEATGTVINVMKWNKASDFVSFRDSNQDIIAPVLGKFAPKGRLLKIAIEVAAKH